MEPEKNYEKTEEEEEEVESVSTALLKMSIAPKEPEKNYEETEGEEEESVSTASLKTAISKTPPLNDTIIEEDTLSIDESTLENLKVECINERQMLIDKINDLMNIKTLKINQLALIEQQRDEHETLIQKCHNLDLYYGTCVSHYTNLLDISHRKSSDVSTSKSNQNENEEQNGDGAEVQQPRCCCLSFKNSEQTRLHSLLITAEDRAEIYMHRIKYHEKALRDLHLDEMKIRRDLMKFQSTIIALSATITKSINEGMKTQ